MAAIAIFPALVTFHPPDLRCCGMDQAVNQCKLSVVHHDDSTIQYCKQAGIVYQSYSPLCGGFNGSSCSRGGGVNVMTQPEVLQVATAHGVSAAQIGSCNSKTTSLHWFCNLIGAWHDTVGLKWIVQQGYPLTTAVWSE